jgi:hypothetical protein
MDAALGELVRRRAGGLSTATCHFRLNDGQRQRVRTLIAGL